MLLMLLALGAGCGGSSDKATSTAGKTGASAGATSATSATAVTTSTGAASTATSAGLGALSGKWSGQYQQTAPTSSNGTFVLTWQQSGSDLSGTISVAGPSPFDASITGTLQGANIRFGTLGQGAISYSGSVAGDTMSGAYQDSTGTYKGTWKATKSA